MITYCANAANESRSTRMRSSNVRKVESNYWAAKPHKALKACPNTSQVHAHKKKRVPCWWKGVIPVELPHNFASTAAQQTDSQARIVARSGLLAGIPFRIDNLCLYVRGISPRSSSAIDMPSACAEHNRGAPRKPLWFLPPQKELSKGFELGC